MALVALLAGTYFQGIDPYYKLQVINTVGINASQNSAGEIQLSPIDGLPAAIAAKLINLLSITGDDRVKSAC